MSNYMECDAKELVSQIGRMNIWAISGGRVLVRNTGITLKVGNGYFVEIDLHISDTYTVKRVYQTKRTRIVKGIVNDVYCEEIGEVAYLASCYVNVSFGDDIK